MTIPAPRAGAVVRYVFLWSDEARSGAVKGRKDRPVAVVLATRREEGDVMVTVVPVTHTPPADPAAAVEMPAAVARRLGLDGMRHWIICDEANRFAWPGFDLRPIPNRPGTFEYGMLPQAVYQRVKATILALYRARRLNTTARD